MSLKSSDILLSNDIIFVLYNLYYINQMKDLRIRVGPVNRDGGVAP